MMDNHPSPGTPPMSETKTVSYNPDDLRHLPDDLRKFIERLAANGIRATPPYIGADNPLPEPLRLRTSLSDAILEERYEE